MERLVARAGLVGVVVMVYLDDVLVVGRGKLNTRKQAASLVLHWCHEGAAISIKSTLEPTRRLVWLGKVVALTWASCPLQVLHASPFGHTGV